MGMDLSSSRRDAIDRRWRAVVLIAVFLSTAFIWALTRLWTVTGTNPSGKPAADFTRIWQPLADRVLAGAPLYSSGVADNKPPLFLAVDIVTGFAPSHAGAFILLTGLINGLVAVVLWRLGRQYDREFAGVLAGVLYLAFVPLFDGQFIQAGSYTVLFVLLAVHANRAMLSGVWIAVAGLFYQYAVLLVPVVFGLRLTQDRHTPVRRGLYYCFGGLVTVGLVFLGVALLWSPRSALLGLHWSFGLPTGVTSAPVQSFTTEPATYASGLWLFTNPSKWAEEMSHALGFLIPLLIPVGVALRTVQWRIADGSLISHAVVLTVASTIPLVIRTYLDYVVLLLPFVCLLAAIGLIKLFEAADA
ncbi:hypothetical protein [Halocatena halophila]|uniref:hypothetical protein n=1 Tax=Halocatena halophila TaxID=2814576 RepID=UPI002ED36AAC